MTDGGSAFPLPQNADGGGRRGMSLRDYFAAHMALAVYADNARLDHYDHFEAAREAYKIADAMLKVREEQS